MSSCLAIKHWNSSQTYTRIWCWCSSIMGRQLNITRVFQMKRIISQCSMLRPTWWYWWKARLVNRIATLTTMVSLKTAYINCVNTESVLTSHSCIIIKISNLIKILRFKNQLKYCRLISNNRKNTWDINKDLINHRGMKHFYQKWKKIWNSIYLINL